MLVEEAAAGLLIFCGFAAVFAVVAYIADSRIGRRIAQWLEAILWK